MSLYKINNIELEIDMEDYDFQKKYEDAFEKMAVEEKELQKIGKRSEITFRYCQMFYNLFDDIFGAGTGEKLFEGKHNMRTTNEIYEEFIGICTEQARRSAAQLNSITNKYAPKNRAQRRAAAKRPS